MARNRDFFAAIVLGGLAVTACSSSSEVADAGPDATTDTTVADATITDAGDMDVSTEDAGDDAFVAII